MMDSDVDFITTIFITSFNQNYMFIISILRVLVIGLCTLIAQQGFALFTKEKADLILFLAL